MATTSNALTPIRPIAADDVHHDVDDVDPEVQQLRAEIAQTRASMSDTIEALQDKLSPHAIKEHALDQLREVKDNITSGVKAEFEEVKEAVVEVKDEALREATRLEEEERPVIIQLPELETEVNQVNQSAVTEATPSTTSTIKRLAVRAAVAGLRLEKRVAEFYHEKPLAAGAAIAAVGVLIGLAIPMTRRENQLMGKKRDDMLHKAESFANRFVGKAEGLGTVGKVVFLSL